jgi:hypothetical protein
MVDMDDDHMAVWEAEQDDSDRAWTTWVTDVERLIGHDLDGSLNEDGYSLDTAYDMWKQGLTVLQAAATIYNSERNRRH